MSNPLDHLDALESALTAANFPPMSAWWRKTFERFFRSKKRQLVLRVGRRGGKSSMLCRIAVLLALFGEWTITPGDVGILGFVSVSRDEASQRLRMIKEILATLSVPWHPVEGGIELDGKPVVFKVFTASIAGVVGGSWLALFGDELARWRDADSGANPATQVLESARPALAGQPNARLFLSSSALGTLDAHARAVDAGSNGFQEVALATTWEARPSLTEEMTHELETDAKVWAREYAITPQEGISSALDADQCKACIRPFRQGHPLGPPFLGADLSQGKKDSTAWVVGQWWQPVLSEFEKYDYTFNEDTGGWTPNWAVGTGSRKPRVPAPPEPRPELRITSVTSAGAFVRDGRGLVTMDHVYDAIGRTAQQSGARVAFADDYLGEAAKASMALRKVSWDYKQWNPGTIEDQFAVLRGWLRDGELAIEDTPMGHALVRELVGLAEIVRPSGGLSFGGRRGTHDDLAACVRSIAQAQAELRLPGSPVRHRGSEIQIFTGQGRRLY